MNGYAPGCVCTRNAMMTLKRVKALNVDISLNKD